MRSGRHVTAMSLAVLASCLETPALGQVDSHATMIQTTSFGASASARSDALTKMDAELEQLVNHQRLAGAVVLVARKGQVEHLQAYGQRGLVTNAAMTTDTLFRIASMSKPITGVAMMILHEQGRWKLDDPVALHIPEFATLKVATPDGLADQAHPMTMRELMSHTAGFDINAGYTSAGLGDGNLQDMIDKLALLPLAAQPGTDWRYGPSVNIQGYLVEKLSGQSLDGFLQQNIFGPLEMNDTGFWIDEVDQARVAHVTSYDDNGRIAYPDGVGDFMRGAKVAVSTTGSYWEFMRAAPTEKPEFLAGAAGLISTAHDYWRFAQMLANGGELDGARVLRPETVALLSRNVLAEGVSVDLAGDSETEATPGIGFGLDFAVVMTPEAAQMPYGLGTYYWGGALGTWFWIDPLNELVVVGMSQNLRDVRGSRPDLRGLTAGTIYPVLDQIGSQ